MSSHELFWEEELWCSADSAVWPAGSLYNCNVGPPLKRAASRSTATFKTCGDDDHNMSDK